MAFFKACAEAGLLGVAVTVAIIVSIWLFMCPLETKWGWIWKTICCLPSLVFQFLWARTCWLFYTYMRTDRGSEVILPIEDPYDPEDPSEPLLPSNGDDIPFISTDYAFGSNGMAKPPATAEKDSAPSNGASSIYLPTSHVDPSPAPGDPADLKTSPATDIAAATGDSPELPDTPELQTSVPPSNPSSSSASVGRSRSIISPPNDTARAPSTSTNSSSTSQVSQESAAPQAAARGSRSSSPVKTKAPAGAGRAADSAAAAAFRYASVRSAVMKGESVPNEGSNADIIIEGFTSVAGAVKKLSSTALGEKSATARSLYSSVGQSLTARASTSTTTLFRSARSTPTTSTSASTADTGFPSPKPKRTTEPSSPPFATTAVQPSDSQNAPGDADPETPTAFAPPVSAASTAPDFADGDTVSLSTCRSPDSTSGIACELPPSASAEMPVPGSPPVLSRPEPSSTPPPPEAESSSPPPPRRTTSPPNTATFSDLMGILKTRVTSKVGGKAHPGAPMLPNLGFPAEFSATSSQPIWQAAAKRHLGNTFRDANTTAGESSKKAPRRWAGAAAAQAAGRGGAFDGHASTDDEAENFASFHSSPTPKGPDALPGGGGQSRFFGSNFGRPNTDASAMGSANISASMKGMFGRMMNKPTGAPPSSNN